MRWSGHVYRRPKTAHVRQNEAFLVEDSYTITAKTHRIQNVYTTGNLA